MKKKSTVKGDKDQFIKAENMINVTPAQRSEIESIRTQASQVLSQFRQENLQFSKLLSFDNFKGAV